MMKKTGRKAGILLHPTSLPGKYGIGEIGPQARRFVKTLEEMAQGVWQILPLCPTGYGDSPYQGLSTFAGNHLLISFQDLREAGLISAAVLADFPEFSSDAVDYGSVIPERLRLLRRVCRLFPRSASARMKRRFEVFCERNAHWLDDYALFMALKDAQGGRPWIRWPKPLRNREEAALREARRKYRTAIREVKLMQFLFDEQWRRLHRYAGRYGVKIVGDLPIFVAHDSADVWAHPELFYMDGRGRLTVQAGVPPDYFSETGQLWGNPLYRWEEHRRTGYEWWVGRMRRMLEMVDIVRIDHFRGFEKYWEVPGDAVTAEKGRWVEGPGGEMFDVLLEKVGPLPIIAEDLGVITPEVEELRDRYGFPGMRILQFAFSDEPEAENYLPEKYPSNCVVYTGTHDNDTTWGWFHGSPGRSNTHSREEIERERRAVLRYLGTDGSQIHWDLIAVALRSRAELAIVPLQDVLGLGSEARMNRPGTAAGNWRWRFTWKMLTPAVRMRLKKLTEESGRGV